MRLSTAPWRRGRCCCAMEYRAEPGWHTHIERLARDLLERVADDVLDDAQRIVPIDTGRLLMSLGMEIRGTTARIGSRDVDYSVYVELGHRIVYRDRNTGELVDTGRVQPPQPYLRPALYRVRRY